MGCKIALTVIAAALVPGSPAVAAETPVDASAEAPPAQWAQAAFEFAFPVYEIMRTRAVFLAQEGRKVNEIRHRQTLSKAADRQVTAPNNDTLYSSAWLDLTAGPIILDVPTTGKRYHSVEFMDLFTDAFKVIGTRTDRGQAGRYMIVGPKWKGKAAAGTQLIRAPMNDVWMLARTLVYGPEDLETAQAVQRGYRLSVSKPLSPARSFSLPTPRRPSPAEFLDVVNAALARGPLPEVHQSRLEAFAAAGIRPGKQGVFSALAPAAQTEWQRGLPQMYASLVRAFADSGVDHNGWRHPTPGLAQFGTDDRYRSRIALSALAALPLGESANRTALVDQDRMKFDGHNDYVLKLPAQIPVDGFWSVTLYEPDGDGRWFFYDNPSDRYSIGNRTAGLVRDADGGITIRIQHGQPDSGNWLPAPQGPFGLSFRSYLPRPEMSNGTFILPPVQKVR